MGSSSRSRRQYWLVALFFWTAPATGETALLQEIAQAIHASHISRPPVHDVLQVFPRALKNYLRSLDPYSDYLTPQEYSQQKAQAGSGYTGIGVEIVAEGERVALVPFLGSPADGAGIRHRYYLDSVDDKSIAGKSAKEVADIMNGPAGSVVKLGVREAPTGSVRTFEVRRKAFKPSAVEYVEEGKLRYVRIRSFVRNEAVAELRVVVERLRRAGEPVVIDLRDSGGGDFYEAVDSAAVFLAPGDVVAYTVDGLGSRQTLWVRSNGPFNDRRVLLLVGPGTASAAEVFARALHFHLKALVVGRPTYGKCTSQTYVELSNGAALKLTNLKILDPEGNYCDGRGLTPDLTVPPGREDNTEDLVAEGLSRLSG